MNSRQPILLLEDDRVDALTVKRVLHDLQISNRLEIAGNGEEALAYLRDQHQEKPCVILLDLNMPKMNGIEFLKIAKADDRLKMIPIIVLTTSRDQQDRMESFDHSVAGYMVKPIEYDHFIEMMRTIDRYWGISEIAGYESPAMVLEK